MLVVVLLFKVVKLLLSQTFGFFLLLFQNCLTLGDGLRDHLLEFFLARYDEEIHAMNCSSLAIEGVSRNAICNWF